MKKYVVALLFAVLLTLVAVEFAYAYCALENPLGGCLIEVP